MVALGLGEIITNSPRIVWSLVMPSLTAQQQQDVFSGNRENTQVVDIDLNKFNQFSTIPGQTIPSRVQIEQEGLKVQVMIDSEGIRIS